MALPSDHIYIPDLLNLLGIISNPANVGAACIADNINKWSKYKPIRDTGPGPNWPAGSNGKYGFNLPTNWDYLKPRGGAVDEWYRPSDFRGYEHDKTLAFPSIQCRDTDQAAGHDVYPSGSPYAIAFKIRAYRSASNIIIIPSDLGLDNYYVGIKLSFAEATWYKTFGQVSAYDFSGTAGFSLNAALTIVGGNVQYSDLPFGVGLADWELFISQNECASWANNLAGTIIHFPEDTDGTNTFIKAGHFHVHDWIMLLQAGVEDTTMIFGQAASSQDATVRVSSTATPNFSISDDAGWIVLAVYDGSTLIDNPNLYLDGHTLRVSVSAFDQTCPVFVQVASGQDWGLLNSSGSLQGGGSRVGHANVSSGGTNKSIEVTQGVAGSNQLTFSFTADDNLGINIPLDVVIKRGETTVFSDTTGAFQGRSNTLKSYTVTINENGIAGETYVVTLSRH
jgi:hypothetical protein